MSNGPSFGAGYLMGVLANGQEKVSQQMWDLAARASGRRGDALLAQMEALMAENAQLRTQCNANYAAYADEARRRAAVERDRRDLEEILSWDRPAA